MNLVNNTIKIIFDFNSSCEKAAQNCSNLAGLLLGPVVLRVGDGGGRTRKIHAFYHKDYVLTTYGTILPNVTQEL